MMIQSKWSVVVALATLSLAACTNVPHRAPVEDRSNVSPRAGLASHSAGANGAASSTETPKALPGSENSGRPGYYTVKPADTLIRIALESGQNWKDLVKWNNLENANVIEVGQVLRVVPPGVDPSAATTRPVTSSRVETKQPEPKASAPVVSIAPAPAVASPVAAVAPIAASAPAVSAPVVTPPPARDGDDEVNWAWPAGGPVLAPFEEGKVKGLSIGGKVGDPVLAAADGRVVYAGSGLRGYGNLIILKHNNTYLTAYAHNQSLLVREDQSVRRGQKIAEMGSTDADGVRLHFEIRKQGKPLDPARLLPAR